MHSFCMIKYTREILEKAVKESLNITQVLKALGISNYGGGMANHIHSRIKKLEISTSHFLWNKTNSGSRYKGGCEKRTAESLLVKRSPNERRESGKRLRRALVESGVAYECSLCKVSDWQNRSLTLEVDHINGQRTDDRKENLRFLCPNCHSQQIKSGE